MAFWNRSKAAAPVVTRKEPSAPNPHTNPRVRSAGFSSGDVPRLLQGWETTSHSIDHYLHAELRSLRARSRKMVRANPYGKRFIAMIKSNVVGPSGIIIQAQSTIYRAGKGELLDTPANDAIEKAFADWCKDHCDYHGRSSWVDMQTLAISCAAQDGEYLFRKRYTGKYGFQLQALDPELLDTLKNEVTRAGNEIRLGIEYDKSDRVKRYWFRERQRNQYDMGKSYAVPANQIIHGFITEWPDQSRGAPWMHASLERSKHLEKYDEAAIVKARSTAATMAVLRSPTGEESYVGDDIETDQEDVVLDQYEAGTIKDIGDRELINVDSDYPHQMYASFVKAQLQGIASGLGISYHALANDLEGVNYSSIRAGVLEDREVYKGLQNWFVRGLVQKVYEEWLVHSYARDVIMIGTRPLARPLDQYKAAHYQARRWAWVDPQKDGAANQLAIDYKLKSRSQIMREMGDDPESTWREIQREEDMLEELGIDSTPPSQQVAPPKEEDDDAESNAGKTKQGA